MTHTQNVFGKVVRTFPASQTQLQKTFLQLSSAVVLDLCSMRELFELSASHFCYPQAMYCLSHVWEKNVGLTTCRLDFKKCRHCHLFVKFVES